jgi:ribosomal protein S12 methylthiotransferase accessory factor
LFGLLEVIERDAFLVSWHSGRLAAQIDAAGCGDPKARAMMARLQAEGLNLGIFDIGVGLPGAALAVKILDPDRRFGPSMAYAAAAHVTAEGALVGALQEVATIFEPVSDEERQANDDRGRELLADPFLVRTMPDHTMQCWPEEAIALRSFNESPEPPRAWQDYVKARLLDTSDQHSVFGQLLHGTLPHCHDVLLVDQGFEPARSSGLHFAKILAPGLLPMTFGHVNRRISHDRLSALCGVSPSGSYRQDPHVFP